ncbi:MAG: adenylyltransferase/cytidyltransferase family protein, partial [Candidatus Aenigmarchaeota archaeon]|nr:adenylyltransferase/cytidyltransferase family protein [Candidatus Aenigmarchaeota archaeon]
MKTALFVARLQPLHKGHAYAIRKVLGKYKVIVGIGSSNVSNEDNPFSFQQRKRMVKAVFGSATKVIPLKDFGDDKKWT